MQFRTLDDKAKFGRWQWIEYNYIVPRGDRRAESRSVVDGSIRIVGEMRRSERARFLRPLVVEDVAEAQERGQTLTLIEPRDVDFSWQRKSDAEIEHEAAEYAEWASQMNLFSQAVVPMEPSPYKFTFRYRDGKGAARTATCDDWETGVAFRRRLEAKASEEDALADLRKTYAVDYPANGMVFAMGTHSLFPKTWLLVGVIRLDRDSQGDLFV